jgi:hypothetical protein
MAFQKGQSGNPNGRPADGTSWAAVLEKIGGETIVSGKETLTKKEAVARKLWGEAAKGEAWAINALMDRLDGKPRQAIDHTTKGEMVNSISPHQFVGED